jgi:hypothetical protein
MGNATLSPGISAKKKSRIDLKKSIRDIPIFPVDLMRASLRPRSMRSILQAGLLTYGSLCRLRLPNVIVSDIDAAIVPEYSSGPVSDSHGVPY